LNLMAQLDKKLKALRLSGILQTLEDRLKQAKSQKLGYVDFLEIILEDEIERREAKKLDLRLRRASFEEEKTLEGVDWTFNATISESQFWDLAACHFIERSYVTPRICAGKSPATAARCQRTRMRDGGALVRPAVPSALHGALVRNHADRGPLTNKGR